MIVVLAGAPGAGKGTQADLLVAKKGFKKLATGDALRKHISLKTAIGQKAESFMRDGLLVPDEVLLQILEAEIGSEGPNAKILLDGYPRNVKQAATLDGLKGPHKVALAIQLDVPREVLLRRLGGRLVCSGCGKSFHEIENKPKQPGVCDACGGTLAKRPDDHPDKIGVRLNVYDEQTFPVLDYYRSQSRLEVVSGMGQQEEIFGRICAALERVSLP